MLHRRLVVGGLALAACRAGRPQPANGPGALERSPPLGLQLYSVRTALEQDPLGTLKRVRALGFETVELHRTSFPPALLRQQLGAADLTPAGVMVAFDRLSGDLAAVIGEARTLGVDYVCCPWIPHEEPFSEADARRAIAVFSDAGPRLRDAGLRLFSHIHGYELRPAGEGRLLDLMLREATPGIVDFELDVFYVVQGGADPVALLDGHPGRFSLLHLKDMKRGTPVGVHTGKADPESTTAVGSGILDFPRILSAAKRAGVSGYFVEDESRDAFANLPRSVAYLRPRLS